MQIISVTALDKIHISDLCNIPTANQNVKNNLEFILFLVLNLTLQQCKKIKSLIIKLKQKKLLSIWKAAFFISAFVILAYYFTP